MTVPFSSVSMWSSGPLVQQPDNGTLRKHASTAPLTFRIALLTAP
jgi:hypothetical protein